MNIRGALGTGASATHAERTDRENAARSLAAGAAALSFSVAADSALEHYRGGFYNRVMYAAPAVSALSLIASASTARRAPGGGVRGIVFATALGTGLVGTVFHLSNVLKREGGLSWHNLFYGAPIGAPLGIAFAGGFGLAAESLRRPRSRRSSVRAARVLSVTSAIGLLGTAAEAGLLHFRGAFHIRAMYIPVTLPPAAALALLASTRSSTRAGRAAARSLLRATAAAGLAGAVYHAAGVHRYMGGWRNWSQSILQGPPLSAPPSFTGMALAGIAALGLMEDRSDGR